MMAKKQADTIKLRPIRRKPEQRATLIGLGLNKVGRERALTNSPAVQGMIAKVSHLIEVVEE